MEYNEEEFAEDGYMTKHKNQNLEQSISLSCRESKTIINKAKTN